MVCTSCSCGNDRPQVRLDTLVNFHRAEPRFAGQFSSRRNKLWPLSEIAELNRQYQVQELAPGFVGFATSGGGEMFALAEDGSVVCLPFVGMAPEAALKIAGSWTEFTGLLRAIN
jgi:hypothetical protein